MKAFFIVLLVLTVLGLLPLGVNGGWATGESVTLDVRIGFIRLHLLPKKKAEPKAAKPAKPKKEKKKGGLASLSKKGKLALIKAVLRALGRFREKLRVEYLRFHFTMASPDPFKTAMGFGIASGAASGLVPLLDDAFDIEHRDVGPAFDFTSTKPRTDVWITASILLWQGIYIAAALGIDYLKIKKQYAAEPADDPETDKRKD